MTPTNLTTELHQATEAMLADPWTPTRFARRIGRVSVSVWRSESAGGWTAFLQFRAGDRDETCELRDPDLAMIKLLAEREAERVNTQLEFVERCQLEIPARALSMVDVLEGGSRG